MYRDFNMKTLDCKILYTINNVLAPLKVYIGRILIIIHFFLNSTKAFYHHPNIS